MGPLPSLVFSISVSPKVHSPRSILACKAGLPVQIKKDAVLPCSLVTQKAAAAWLSFVQSEANRRQEAGNNAIRR